nr:zinc finger, CCHC-type [Tanacetum cinerariifolium]
MSAQGFLIGASNKNIHLVLSQVDIRDTHAIGSNSLLWKMITRFQVISGSHWGGLQNMAEEDALLALQHECSNVKTYKELWNILEAKYMAEDASSKKFLVSNFTNYKMTDSRPVLEQYNEVLGIIGRFTQHKMNMDESIQEELTLVELGSHLRIKESLRVHDNDKPKGDNVAGLSVVNMMKHNNSFRVPNKRNRITSYELSTKKKPNLNYLRVWGCKAFVRLLDPKLKTLGKRGIKCIFVGYAKHSKVFVFYIIEPNDSVTINSIIESRDAIFDKNRFSSVSRPSQRSMVNETEDIGGSVVLEKVTKEVVQQPEPELRKSKRHRTPKDFGPEFQLYLIEGIRDEVHGTFRGRKRKSTRTIEA